MTRGKEPDAGDAVVVCQKLAGLKEAVSPAESTNPEAERPQHKEHKEKKPTVSGWRRRGRHSREEGQVNVHQVALITGAGSSRGGPSK